MLEETKRITNVIRVLSKYGLAGTLTKYGFAWWLPIFKRTPTELPQDLPKRLRQAMEELGGAYIKLGQLLSVRPDLVPQEYCDEFTKLQDQVPPEPLSDIQKVIENEFKKPLTEIYTHIDPRPLGSASVAQVHKARLKTGQAVAIKVQRTGIKQKFQEDIHIIRYLSQKIQKHLTNKINLLIIVDEFERYTKKELDFTTEANHIDDIRAEVHKAIIPKVYWQYTTEKVLTMDYLDGTKITDLPEKEKPETAKELVNILLEQLFTTGTFHADLHPGNVLLMKNGKIGLLDFGIIGHITPEIQKQGLELYLAILDRHPRQITETLLKYGTPSSKTNLNKFQQEITNKVETWWEDNPQKRRVTHLMHQLFVLCAQNNIQLPSDTILIGKALITAEATARQLDPNFNFIKYSQPKIEQLLKQQKTPTKIINEFKTRTKTILDAITKIPTTTLDAINTIKQGNLNINLKDTSFRHIGKDLNTSSNRLSYSIIAASLIMMSALTIEVGPKIGTYSTISVLALMAATFFTISLLVSVSREHTEKYDKHEL